MPTRIYRDILAKFLSPFLTGMGTFTALLLVDQLSRSVDTLLTQSSETFSLLVSFFLLALPVLTYSLPMAFLLGFIAAIEQMKHDRQTIVFFSAGISPLALLPPFLAMAAAAAGFLYWMNTTLVPAGLQEYNGRLLALARTQILNDLTPGLFFRGIPGTVLLVGDADRETGDIRGVLLVKGKEREQEDMILAERGSIRFPAGGSDITLLLMDGAIHPVSAPGSAYYSAGFAQLATTMEGTEPESALSRDQALMASTSADLARRMEDARARGDLAGERRLQMEKGRRIASPLALLLYPFLLFPLALSSRRFGKAAAFAASLLLFLGQFALTYLGMTLGSQGLITPHAAPFLPDLILASAAAALFLPFVLRQGGGSILSRRMTSA